MACFEEMRIVLVSTGQKILLCIYWETQEDGNVGLVLSFLHQQRRPQYERLSPASKLMRRE